jgi:hypothetical protein
MLRSLHGFDAQDVGDATRKLAGLPNVHLEDRSAVAQALSWQAGGVDFTDGMSSLVSHLRDPAIQKKIRAASS